MPPPLSPLDQDAPGSRTRRPRAIGVVVGIIVLISLILAAGVGAYFGPRWDTPQSQHPSAGRASMQVGGSFSLVDQFGRPVTDRDFRGRFMLIYFGYTTCPNHCPTMLMMTAAALETLGQRARQVQPIFITVDPEHDTPEIMGRYTSKFSPRILGLTGSPAQIESVEKAYRVETLFRRTGPEEGSYVIDHPSVFYLVGPDGRFIGELQAEGSAEDLATQLRRRL